MEFDIVKYLEKNKIELGTVKRAYGDNVFKGGHNDLRKTRYDVKIKEDGKLDLYTHKKILNEETRPISQIAAEISRDWKKMSPHAKPYVDAMFSLNKIMDKYYQDSGKSVVAYFLGNAGTWRGEVAKRVKIELKKMLK